jgi:hypothetical protein
MNLFTLAHGLHPTFRWIDLPICCTCCSLLVLWPILILSFPLSFYMRPVFTYVLVGLAYFTVGFYVYAAYESKAPGALPYILALTPALSATAGLLTAFFHTRHYY